MIQFFIKRSFDIFASLFGLILFAPLFLIIAFLIKISMPGPVIFRQKRAGRLGKAFTIYKFRTMITTHNGKTISVKGDSRITPLGAFLRKYKFDEMPELWNVLKGEMSFVGPRPDMQLYADKLIGEERKILEMLPGITGPATLKYANEEELLASVSNPERYNDEVIWPDKVRINMNYYYKQSFKRDIYIIFNTIFRKRNNSQSH